MATNNATGQSARSAQPDKGGLLSGLIVKGEHMLALGCAGLIVALVACGVITWYTITSWATPADPEQTTVILRRGEVERSSLDSCPVGMTKHYTQRGSVCR
jgi:hypothetical protein